MILARYLANRYFRAFMLLAGVFMALLLLIDMVEQIRRFADRGITLGEAARRTIVEGYDLKRVSLPKLIDWVESHRP